MFNWPIRVYYEDTDCGGVVYHSNYLKFMEQARTEWLRTLGFEQDILIAEYGIIFAVRSLSIDYLRPALFNQLLRVESSIEKLTKVSIIFRQSLYLDTESSAGENKTHKSELLSSANVKIVSLAYDQQQKKILGPKKLPSDIFQALSSKE
jgi:tol-pal system-associated acyl-CoA thioesterase